MRQWQRTMLSACLVGLTCLAGNVYGAPKIVMEGRSYHAGNVMQGQPIVHDFALKNAGNEALTIQVKPC